MPDSSNEYSSTASSAVPTGDTSSQKRPKSKREHKHEHKREHKRHKKSLEETAVSVSSSQSTDSSSSLSSAHAVATQPNVQLREEANFESPQLSQLSPQSKPTDISTGSACSQLDGAFQSPADASCESSVCTSATTPSNGLFYLDLLDGKLQKKLRRRERRERKRAAREGGLSGSTDSHGKKKHRKHRDSMSVSSVDSSRVLEEDTGTHDRSALTAILGSVHSPRPA